MDKSDCKICILGIGETDLFWGGWAGYVTQIWQPCILLWKNAKFKMWSKRCDVPSKTYLR